MSCLTLAFLRPSADDKWMNRLTARASRHGICHVELVFDGMMAFSIYHDSTPFLKQRSMSNPGYEFVSLSVSSKEYRAALQFCRSAVAEAYAFDDRGLYLASVHPGGCLDKPSSAVGKTFSLDSPFLVLATQNPVEQEGTYPLPEAQLDRFMFLIELDYPSEDEEIRIARTTTGGSLPSLAHLLDGPQIVRHQELVRRVPVPDHIYSYAAKLVRKTRPQGSTAPAWLKPLVSWGAGPRAVQCLILGAKARAALLGSYMTRLEDIQQVAEPVLTHRIITTFAAQAEGVDAKQIVRRLVAETPSDHS